MPPIKAWGAGSLSLTEIQAEFGGSNPIGLNEYYSGGANVPSGTVGFPGGVATVIPSSGQISVANFYGASKQIVYTFSGANTLTAFGIPAGRWYVYAYLVGAGGGGGAGDEAVFGGAGGSGASIKAKWVINSTTSQYLMGAAGTGGGPGQNGSGGRVGGNPGRTYGWSNNTLPPSTQTGGQESWYAPTWKSNTWHPLLITNAFWHTEFDTQGINARVPLQIFFPYTGSYTLLGLADDRFRVYLDTISNLVANFDGYGSPRTAAISTTQGWHTLYLAADNSGGSNKAAALGIANSGGTYFFASKNLVGGGWNSGAYWFLNGGSGGGSGFPGSSGSAGGGGSGTGLLWYPNFAGLTTTENYQVLGIAPGGGGGAGTGRSVNRSPIQYQTNWMNRGATLSAGTALSTSAPWPNDSGLWNSRPVGSRVPYNVSQYLHGQGVGNAEDYYPPNGTPAPYAFYWDWDGGAGGGGGSTWGRAGGYAERPGSWWFLSTDKSGQSIWTAPLESSGSGGSQGYIYLNNSYVSSYLFSETNSYWTSYGGGGVGVSGYGQTAGRGQSGAFSVRISNVDDNVWPF